MNLINNNLLDKEKNLKIGEDEIFLQINKKRRFYESKINGFLADLNISNARPIWWAFNFTSKNPLSSDLFEKLMVVLAIIDIIDNNPIKQINFNNLTIGQRKIINEYFGLKPKYFVKNFYNFFYKNKFFQFLKIIYLLIEIFFTFLSFKNKISKSNILLFTYIDGGKRNGKDTYFGNLLNKIIEDYPKKKVAYLFYLDRPYFKMKRDLSNEKANYNFIFKYLKLNDYAWSFIQVVKANFILIKNSNFVFKNKNISLNEIVKETMVMELSRGFLDNILVYSASKRLRQAPELETIIYPFENKSLEKLLNLGLNDKVKTVGYQHSSITPRHFCFIMNDKEINRTPLPDKVVTLGEITKRWLTDNCNFPSSMVIKGVALRNNFSKLLNKKSFSAEKANLLFVFSSSKYEIKQSIKIIKDILIDYSFNCRFRFHVNFPLKSLSKENQKWVKSNIDLVKKNTLLNDFKWADITIYISSTVALESLLCGIPIIRLNIDKFNSDPLLNKKVPFKWSANSSTELVKSIYEISYLSDKDRKQRSIKGQIFASSYMIPEKLLKT